MKRILWKLSMKWIVFASIHFLPRRDHTGTELEKYGLGFSITPEEDRWTLHTLAAAPPDHPYPDYTFHVAPVTEKDFQYHHPAEAEMGWFIAHECESGGYAWGRTAEEALNNYWHQ